jgi:hypothetical protein
MTMTARIYLLQNSEIMLKIQPPTPLTAPEMMVRMFGGRQSAMPSKPAYILPLALCPGVSQIGNVEVVFVTKWEGLLVVPETLFKVIIGWTSI